MYCEAVYETPLPSSEETPLPSRGMASTSQNGTNHNNSVIRGHDDVYETPLPGREDEPPFPSRGIASTTSQNGTNHYL